MLLLGIDLETGGNFEDPLEENFITEIGAVLWDTNHGPVKIFSELLDLEKIICEEAEQYTGITNEVRVKYGILVDSLAFTQSLRDLKFMMTNVEYIVAHNGLAFDKPILNEFFSSILKTPMPETTWIDTMIDVPYPKNCTSRSLTYLAGFHLLLNCFPHRAITDVMMMMAIMDKYNLDEVIKCASSPMVDAVWAVPFPQKSKFKGDAAGFINAMKTFNTQKELASKNRFRWNRDEKEWVLTTRKHLLPKIDLPYKVRGLENEETGKEN